MLSKNEMLEVLKKGKYYSDTKIRYSHLKEGYSVMCDRCNKKCIVCIGYKDKDICLSCIDIIADEQEKLSAEVKKEDEMKRDTYMMQSDLKLRTLMGQSDLNPRRGWFDYDYDSVKGVGSGVGQAHHHTPSIARPRGLDGKPIIDIHHTPSIARPRGLDGKPIIDVRHTPLIREPSVMYTTNMEQSDLRPCTRMMGG